MSGAYPPGVTGNEYQISGPDFEVTEIRECKAENYTIRTMSSYGRTNLEQALEMVDNGKINEASLRTLLRSAVQGLENFDFETGCPFVGEVEVSGYMGQASWECPLCETVHEMDMNDD